MQRPNNCNLGPGLFFTVRKNSEPGMWCAIFLSEPVVWCGIFLAEQCLTVYNFGKILFSLATGKMMI